MQPFDLNTANAAYLEQLYELYLQNPQSLDRVWVAFFADLDSASQAPEQKPGEEGAEHRGTGQERRQRQRTDRGIWALVHAYRELGHFIANLDPLGHNQTSHPLLELSQFGLGPEDLEKGVGSGGFLGHTDGSLRDLLAKMRTTYCRTLGVEYTSIIDKNQRDWLQQRIEPHLNRPDYSAAQCRQVLARLLAAEEFEQFLHTRYLGQKRFSLEGADSLLPLLDSLAEHGAELGVEEMVFGMAHRGRLNVLAHLLKKPYEYILAEFEGASHRERSEEEGDVKYHLGYSYDHTTPQGRPIHLSLSANPSHLEMVDPVIEGIVHAKQDYLEDHQRRRVVPVLIHGEAAFTGQGIVAETLSLSQLEHYQTGGTIHIILNNQLGYTATPAETRFTPYPTDVARQIQVPVFHVNANDPEAVVQAGRLAIEFRQEFRRDVLIDLWCYRRHGHNEADDPTFTQPLMYKEIAKHPTVCELYAWELVGQGKITPEEVEELRRQAREKLEKAQEATRGLQVKPRLSVFSGVWKGLTWAEGNWDADTAITPEQVAQVAAAGTQIPSGFSLSRTLQRLVSARLEMAQGQRPVDWGCAEMLGLGSLMLEGVPVRLVGQDSQRGTFSHRHAVWHDTETGQTYTPLAHLSEGQARFTVVNTMLSELAVLGFEYGISSADPRRLVIWEAQFGDFVNCAQPIIDQFLCSSEAKWQRMSGLVLLLPHGFEGMGPEHSSARLERFLQLCAKDNMQVCYPTTAAQFFHLLRRQMRRSFRKPLIVMTPKSLLRHKSSFSPIEVFTAGKFQAVIDDEAATSPGKVRRLILCSGRIYYDLLEARQARGDDGDDVALVRVEQLYPFPRAELEWVLARYAEVETLCWVQEEPRNMGAWSFVCPLIQHLLGEERRLGYVGRDKASSPATGSYPMHQREQREIVAQALGLAAAPPAEGHEELWIEVAQ
ncbi:MAG: 2-oxoglutarate dehydrogenase E1 component [Candidatus Latescibacteria bacterium]|nr:2-oxoglutarate dehydrogenase E1 component [Candidatus Latescibacterota bacterium]